jgi:hypothetical protein
MLRYLHVAMGFPLTLALAICAGRFQSWPGITVKAVSIHFLESNETPKGHMLQIKSGVRSKKETNLKPVEQEQITLDILKLIAALKKKHKDMSIQIVDERNVLYTDQAVKLTLNSSHGYQYIVFTSKIKRNRIFVEPIKTQKETELILTHDNHGKIPHRQNISYQANIRQQIFLRISKRNNSQWHKRCRLCTTKLPQRRCCRKVNPNLQESFQINPLWL